MTQIAWAAALRDARLKKNLTIVKLAQTLMTTTAEIQQYEAGTKTPTLFEKMLLTRALKLPRNFWELTSKEKYQLKLLRGR